MEERIALAGPSGPEELVVRLAAPARHGGPGLLYLHGFGSGQDGEKAAFFRGRAIAAGLAFCSFDFRGHGRSGGTMEGLTLTRCLDDAEAALEVLASRWNGPLAFLGSSMGAATAMWLAARRPSGPARRLAAGVAIAPALTMEASLAALCGQEGLAGWRQSGRLQVSNELVTCELGWALMEDLARHPAAELADRHRTPTLILQGMRDASVDWREVAAFASRCPPGAVELHLFPAGDHRLIAWKERVWDLAAGFLAPRPSRGREAAR